MSDDPKHTLERMRARLASATAPYDDLARARAEHRLFAQLDVLPRPPTELGRGRRSAVLAACAVLALAAALGIAVWLPRGQVVPSAPAARFTPYTEGVVEPSHTKQARPVADPAELAASTGQRVRARVGPHSHVSLEGPALLRLSGSERAPTLELAQGRVLVEVTPGTGTELRVRTGDVEVVVVGTLFAVDAALGAAAVHVRHGHVRVRSAGRVVDVRAEQSWRVGSAQLGALSAELAAALDAHAEVTSSEVLERAVEPVEAAWPAESEPPSGAGASEAPRSERSAAARGRPHRNRPRAPARAVQEEPASSTLAPAPPTSSAIELYRASDRALAAGDVAAARAALVELVHAHGADLLADPARVQLARLALARGDFAEAGGLLDAVNDGSVAEPAAYLRCRIALARRAPSAPDCLAGFRRRFPRSAHANDALADEAAQRAAAGDCARARPLLDTALTLPLSPATLGALRQQRARCE